MYFGKFCLLFYQKINKKGVIVKGSQSRTNSNVLSQGPILGGKRAKTLNPSKIQVATYDTKSSQYFKKLQISLSPKLTKSLKFNATTSNLEALSKFKNGEKLKLNTKNFTKTNRMNKFGTLPKIQSLTARSQSKKNTN